MKQIDLHTHTNYSDGSYEPEALVALAKEAGLLAIAVTDHDNTGGIGRAVAAGKRLDLEVVPGVEFTADYHGQEVHILGYYMDTSHPDFIAIMNEIMELRDRRNTLLIEKLQQLHVPVTLEGLFAGRPGGQVTRMDAARFLVNQKKARDIQDAFDLYLAEGKPAYVERNAVQAERCAAAIHNAGGVCVLAHPYGYNLPDKAVNQLLHEIPAIGFDGIEAYYTNHTLKQQNTLLRYAKAKRLLVTGGSDFHGATRPDTKIGLGLGNLSVPYEVLERMKEKVKTI